MKEYNADSIKILTDIEHIRLRKNMYIGEATDPRHLFSEIYDNALDEVMNEFSDRVDVSIDTDHNSYSVRDYGRGLPQDKKKDLNGLERLTIDIIFNKLNAGGKYDTENYKIASGLHGVGATVTNALSSKLIVKSFRNRHTLEVQYKDGGSLDKVYQYSTNEKDGTEVTFIPDKPMFDTDIIPIEFIKQRCSIANSFGYHTHLYVNNEEIKDIHTSIFDLVPEDDSDIVTFGKFTSDAEDESTGEKITFAIKYTNDTSCTNRGYTNLLPNTQGGTHIRMFEKAFEDAWSRWKVEDVQMRDFYLGLRFVVAAFISETSYSSQTKERLTTDRRYLEKFIPKISDKIYQWLKDNEDLREGLIKRFQDYRASQNKLLSKKELRNLLVINNDNSGSVRRRSVIAKLAECSNKSREGTELFVVEGDSAGGSAIQARNSRTQAILPIRGKTLNVSKFNDYAQCLKNEEVRSIVNAMGTGILDECDVSKARYEKIIFMADSDPDGRNIEALLLAIVVNLLPNVVKAGMVYIANPPLYGWTDKSGKHFTNNIEEIPQGYEIHRYKGLGEMNYEDLRDTTMNPESRTLTPITYPEDINRFNAVMTSARMRFDILVDLGLVAYR